MNETVATIAGREKLAKARGGAKALPKIAKIALGNGGMSDGVLLTPSNDATTLFNETYRKDIAKVIFPDITTAQYSIMLEKSECEGMTFNEMGLVDEEDTLIAIKTFQPTIKDGDMKVEFSMDDEF